MSNIREKLQHFLTYGSGYDYLINFENEVLLENDPDLSTWFVNKVKFANIEEHLKIVVETRDCQILMNFALAIKNIDEEVQEEYIDLIGDYIIAYGNAYQIYSYAVQYSKHSLKKYLDYLVDYTKDNNPMTIMYVENLMMLEKGNLSLKR